MEKAFNLPSNQYFLFFFILRNINCFVFSLGMKWNQYVTEGSLNHLKSLAQLQTTHYYCRKRTRKCANCEGKDEGNKKEHTKHIQPVCVRVPTRM